MKCSRCDSKAATSFKHLGPLCRRCFCSAIEKRVRKNVRLRKPFSKGDRIICVGDLNGYLVRSIIGDMPAEIRYVKTSPKSFPKGSKLMIPMTIDDYISERLFAIFNSKPVSRQKKNMISIVDVMTDDEAAAFCSFKGLMFRPAKKDKALMKIVDAMQEKYAETKFALRKTLEEISL